MVINHQEYIKFQPKDGQDNKEAYSIVFDDENKISDLIDALFKKLGEAPIVGDTPGKDKLIILNQNHTECEPDKPISEYTSTNTTLTLDYKDYVVLHFTTLNEENQVESKFKFIPFADVIKGKKDEHVKLDSN